MGAVSQREYLDFHTRETEADQIDYTLTQTAQEDPKSAPPPNPGRRNVKGQRRPGGRDVSQITTAGWGGVAHGGGDESEWERLEHGEDQGVPEYPQPLPLAHTYAYTETRQAPAQQRNKLDVGPARPYFWGDMAHGVVGPTRYGGRPVPTIEERREHEASAKPKRTEAPAQPKPVPVYIVAEGGGARPLGRCVLQRKPAPAPGNPPNLIVNKDPKRLSVRLLNESATAIRIMTEPIGGGGAATTSDTGFGALLPASMNSYLEIVTQDEIWAVADSGATTLYVSVISQYSVPGGQ